MNLPRTKLCGRALGLSGGKAGAWDVEGEGKVGAWLEEGELRHWLMGLERSWTGGFGWSAWLVVVVIAASLSVISSAGLATPTRPDLPGCCSACVGEFLSVEMGEL